MKGGGGSHEKNRVYIALSPYLSVYLPVSSPCVSFLCSRVHIFVVVQFVAAGGSPDKAIEDIPVNLLNARETPGPIEWDAWAGLSLDTWSVRHSFLAVDPYISYRYASESPLGTP